MKTSWETSVHPVLYLPRRCLDSLQPWVARRMMKSVPRVLHRLIVRWSNDEFCRAILVHIESDWRSTSFDSSPNFECRTSFCNFFEHFKKIMEPPVTTQVAWCHLVISGINRAHGVRQSPFHYFCRRLVIFRPSQSYYDGNRGCVMWP